MFGQHPKPRSIGLVNRSWNPEMHQKNWKSWSIGLVDTLWRRKTSSHDLSALSTFQSLVCSCPQSYVKPKILWAQRSAACVFCVYSRPTSGIGVGSPIFPIIHILRMSMSYAFEEHWILFKREHHYLDLSRVILPGSPTSVPAMEFANFCQKRGYWFRSSSIFDFLENRLLARLTRASLFPY